MSPNRIAGQEGQPDHFQPALVVVPRGSSPRLPGRARAPRSASVHRWAVASVRARRIWCTAPVLAESSRASIASSRDRQPGMSPRACAIRASSLSITKVAALAPMPRTDRGPGRDPPRPHRCRPARRAARRGFGAAGPPRTCPVGGAASSAHDRVPASDRVESPAYHSTPIRKTSDRACSCGSSELRATLELSQGSLDRPSIGEVHGKPAAGERRPARKAVALADPDRQRGCRGARAVSPSSWRAKLRA